MTTVWFITTAGQQTFALPTTPAVIDAVYWNGLLQPPSTYSVTGNSVTVTFSPGSNDEIAIVFEPVVAPLPVPPTPTFAPLGPGGGLINMEEVVVDPDIAQPFTVLRSAGVFVNGSWVSEPTSIQAFGTVSVAEEHEAVMTPEGDVIHGARVFHTNVPIYATQENVGSSDILVWRGQQYRVLRIANYQDYGYYRAIGVRLSTGA